MSEIDKYSDMLYLEHHVSERHPQMSIYDRSAQFAPFAALTGYNDSIDETARLTDEMRELSEYDLDVLSMKINILNEHIKEKPEATILYFIDDPKKKGGKYDTFDGKIKKIDSFHRILLTENEICIPFDCIFDISSNLFDQYSIF